MYLAATRAPDFAHVKSGLRAVQGCQLKFRGQPFSENNDQEVDALNKSSIPQKESLAVSPMSGQVWASQACSHRLHACKNPKFSLPVAAASPPGRASRMRGSAFQHLCSLGSPRALPNPSLKRSPNGGLPGPRAGLCYSPSRGPVIPPLVPA